MKEIPILYSTPMVQTTVEGRKKKTRRVKWLHMINENPGEWSFHEMFTHIGKYERDKYVFRFIDGKGGFMDISCPYGKPGDILWVRESALFLQSHPSPGWIYKADDHSDIEADLKKNGYRWRPSIHMPKAAARIWLEVTDIRVERLQDISEADAIAEGIKSFRPVPGDGPAQTQYYHYTKDKWGPSPIHSFETLWQSINGEESWIANPWVWVVSFKVLSTTGKPDNL